MKVKTQRDKRNYIIAALCLILVVMGVGYAAFSSLLTINGTANISNSWCVGFDNTKTDAYTPKAGITGATAPTGSMSYSGSACGTNLVSASSLTAHFYQPGDEIEYTLTIVNKSSVTAAIKSILVDNESVTSNTTKKKGNITYIVNMPESTTLAPNASTTMNIIAKFQNETDVTGNVNGETKTIEVKINAEQDDGNGGMEVTPAKFTGTVYRNNTNNVLNNVNLSSSYIYANSEGQMGPYEIFTSMEDCAGKYSTQGTYYCQTAENILGSYTEDASTLNKSYYLKHDIVEDTITNSYVCFVYNNTEHCMKAADGGASFAANTQMIKDYQTFYNLNTVSNPSSSNPGCHFTSSSSFCSGGGLYSVGAESVGNVSVNGSSSGSCFASSSGLSGCPGH